MNIITIDDIKENSRIEGNEEDKYIEHLARVSEQIISDAIRRTWWEVEADYGTIPTPLKHAVLMTADHLYTNRSATSQANITVLPLGVRAMIKPYIILK